MRRFAGVLVAALALVAVVPSAGAQTAEPNIRVNAQRPDSRLKGAPKRVVFSTAASEDRPERKIRVRNIGEATLTVSGVVLSDPGDTDSEFFEIVDPEDANGFQIAPHGFNDVEIDFQPGPVVGRYSAFLTVNSNDSNAGSVPILLKGLNAVGYEEANEPTLFSILSTLGYQPSGLPHTNLNPNIVYPDEVRSPYWRVANPRYRVALVPIARYSTLLSSTCCPAGWFDRVPEKFKHRLQRFTGGPASTGENQKTLPIPDPSLPSVTTFVPAGDFGIYSGTDLSDNNALSMRFFRARNAAGFARPDVWLVTEDQGTGGSVVRNFDHNDFVWLLVNAFPAP